MKSHLVCKSTSLCVEFNDCARESFVYALFCVRGKKKHQRLQSTIMD